MKTEQRAQTSREQLEARQTAYKVAFSGVNAAEVLEDLARFCRANESTFHEDARAHALAEGRREVWLRIRDHLELSPDKLWEKYR